MDPIISCASRASWLETPQRIDLSVITRAVLASEKLHAEVLSFENEIQFLSREQRRERDMVSVIFTIFGSGGHNLPLYEAGMKLNHR